MPRIIQLHEGDYNLDRPFFLGKQENSPDLPDSPFIIRGQGPHLTRLIPPVNSPAIVCDAFGNRALNQDRLTDPAASFLGCCIENLSIHGTIGRNQTGLQLSGDCIRVNNVEVWDCDIGITNGPQRSHLRESYFSGCHIRLCRTGLYLEQREGKQGDGINNLDFDSCIISYCNNPVIISNQTHNEVIRGIRWKGGLIHGRRDAEGGLIKLTGRVNQHWWSGRLTLAGHSEYFEKNKFGHFTPEHPRGLEDQAEGRSE